MCIFKINGAKKPKQTTLHSKPIPNKISRTVTFAIQNYTLLLKKKAVFRGNGSSKYFETENKSFITSRKNKGQRRKMYLAHEQGTRENKGNNKLKLQNRLNKCQ